MSVRGRDYQYFALDDVPTKVHLPFSLKVLLENLIRHHDGVNVTDAHLDAVAGWDPQHASDAEIQFTPSRVVMQDFTGVPCVVDLAVMREAVAALGGDMRAVNPQIPTDLVIDHSVIVDFFGSADAMGRNMTREYERNGERYQFLRWGQQAFDAFTVVPPGQGIVHQVNVEYLAQVVTARQLEGNTAIEGGAGESAATGTENADTTATSTTTGATATSAPATGGAKTDMWQVFPDTCVGTDSHTTMVNGMGVLGWGVGGIEAEAAMLGHSLSMVVPPVVGFKLTGEIAGQVSATDVVLTITQKLRELGVVGSFVEFFGPGVAHVPLANRLTIGNMSPEFGCTSAMFPIDEVTLDYLRLTGRSDDHVALVEQYARTQGLWHDPENPAAYSQVIELDLTTVEPSIAGPKRPQDRIALSDSAHAFTRQLPAYTPNPDSVVTLDFAAQGQQSPESAEAPESVGTPDSTAKAPESAGTPASAAKAPDSTTNEPVSTGEKKTVQVGHGAVALAAITSCTNTSNPSVMVAAGILARNARAKGLATRPWVKTSLAPGSQVVTQYLTQSGLADSLQELGFGVVGYGCTTCIGNSGPLPDAMARAVTDDGLVVTAVLSGNRNFEGRINPLVAMNYLASPALVVAYALAGSMNHDFATAPLGTDSAGRPVMLADIWPDPDEVAQIVKTVITTDMFTKSYAEIFAGDSRWQALAVPAGETFDWVDESTYVRRPPYFDGFTAQPQPLVDITDARVLAMLGDSVTTDHISPAGAIPVDSPAGRYLRDHGVGAADFNSYGSRRGNHEVMIRGTFANIRLRNQLVPGVSGGFTHNYVTGEQSTIYDAAQDYSRAQVPLIVLAGAEYGSGSSRDWAAKGTSLLGVRAVIAQSFERIHRSNLVGMGVLPLEFMDGQNAERLGLTGDHTFTIQAVASAAQWPVPQSLTVVATHPDSVKTTSFQVRVRVDTAHEADYLRHGGILPYVVRHMAGV